MKTRKHIICQAFLFLACLLPVTMMAQTQGVTAQAAPQHSKNYLKQQEKARKQLEKEERRAAKLSKKEVESVATEKDVVYIFGVGVNFNDTTLYLSDIQEVPYMKLAKKTKFLPFRSSFSLQFEQYLENTLNIQHETCSVFFDAKRKRLAKHFYKLKKRYLDEGKTEIVVIPKEQFQFKKPIDNVAE